MNKLLILIFSFFLASCSLVNEKIEITCSGNHKKTLDSVLTENDNFSKSFVITKIIHDTIIKNKKENVYDWIIKSDDGINLYNENSESKSDVYNTFSESRLNVDKDTIYFETLRTSDAMEKDKKSSDSFNRIIKINRNSGLFYEYLQMYNAYTLKPFTIVHEFNGTCIKSEKIF